MQRKYQSLENEHMRNEEMVEQLQGLENLHLSFFLFYYTNQRLCIYKNLVHVVENICYSS